ncbi:MAG: S41 family peptidase [Bacteroidota bacterium]
MKPFYSLIIGIICMLSFDVHAQVDARMFRFPDVSENHITFVYAGDIWVAPIAGGEARKLSSPPGEEAFPKFSPDGKSIAFTGNYYGNQDVYVVSTKGGMPVRLTWHDHPDRVLGWHPNDNAVLFASARYSGRQRYSRFFTVNKGQGIPEELPMAYAEYGSFSPDGKKIAFTDKSRLNRTWKRYKGGTAPDIFIYDFEDQTAERLIDTDSNEELPMWSGDNIYYLSDKGDENRFNLWVRDLNTNEDKQLTDFTDFDVHYPSLGPNHIVFEAGGRLYLFNLDDETYDPVSIQLVTDKSTILPKVVNGSKYIQSMSLSPDGNRALVETRGDIFSLPAKKGVVKNISRSSGTAQRFPAWSPDGKHIAYWSDASGEYELYLYDLEKSQEKKLTSLGAGYRYSIYWSPDSKKLSWIDQAMRIYYYDIEDNKVTRMDQGISMFHGGLQSFRISWSPDSRYVAYSRGTDHFNAVFVYDTEENQRHQVTSGYYQDHSPVFGAEGKYLYLLTNRHLSPSYSEMDNTFIYENSTKVAAVPLTTKIRSPLAPENDTVTIATADDNSGEKDKKGKKNDKSGASDSDEAVNIDFDGFEDRMELFEIPNGDYSNLFAIRGNLLFQDNTAAGRGGESKRPLKIFDLKEKEVKTVLDDVDGYDVSHSGEKILVMKNGQAAVIDAKPDQSMKEMLPLNEMELTVDLKAEWQQLFLEAWRLQRDYFYDKNLHGVDWEAMKARYGKLIDDCVTRWDVDYVLGELIGELNASHTYKFGGDTEDSKKRNVGYLGIDWAIEDNLFKIEHLIKGASWDAEVKSPLDDPALDIQEGMYIFEVNGMPLDVTKEPYAAFEGLAGKTVELLVGESSNRDEAKTVVVKTLSSETRLRHLEWIEEKRKRVEEATNGRVGYIYVRSTGVDGQNELARQFYAQYAKDGLIIDERFNSGGQIPDRFIEILNRKPLAYWAVRDGRDWQWPPVANFGPKIMLINGWSGSGGDAFPDYFRKSELGPLLGSTTWGGLIGISGAPQLIDGGLVTVPTFRMYDPSGEWFREGEGVDPDIEVPEDHTDLAKGVDNQLEEAINWMNRALEENPYQKPERPEYEVR